MSDYTRSRWEQIKAMRAPRSVRNKPTSRVRAAMHPVERRRLGAYLHSGNIDHSAKVRFGNGTSGGFVLATRAPASRKPEHMKHVGYRAAPAGFRWHKEQLVPRHARVA